MAGRCGRFAPSPTGPLHLGSLATALASWLDAKAQGTRWIVRMEDLDPPRQEAGADQIILQQLIAHGLTWDTSREPETRASGVMYQSDRQTAYGVVLDDLKRRGLAYACTCSRKMLDDAFAQGIAKKNPDSEIIYPGFCRGRDIRIAPDGRMAWRLLSPEGDDVVIRRSDGLWAYHLAVVIDDAYQGITDIVRGDDLLHSAGRHRVLQTLLGYPVPRLVHVPVLRNAQGEKLSKQTQAEALRTDRDSVIAQRKAAWRHLNAVMPAEWIKNCAEHYTALESKAF